MSVAQAKSLRELMRHKMFSKIAQGIESQKHEYIAFLEHPTCENSVPEVPHHEMGAIESANGKELKRMAVIKALRPDRFIMAVKNFVGKVLGEKVLNVGDLDLMKIVEKESAAKSPLLLVSAPGFDASYKVDMLAKQANKKYTSVAIGSPEAFGLVD